MTAMTKGSRNDRWLDARMNGPSAGMCSRPIRLSRQYRWKNGCRIARSPQYTTGLTPRPRARSSRASRSMCWIPAFGGHGYSSAMPIDRARTARGALAGAIAAGTWTAQSPLDIRAFGVEYSDEALLGKVVTRGPSWPVVGVGLHLLFGASFGAAYANLAPRLPLPSWARGPAVALVEHLSTWPMTVAVDRVHPARD